MKLSPLCLLLTLVTAPALADNLLNRVVTFGRELLDETRKLAPGIQNDQRHATSTTSQSRRLDDGRDSPAIESVPSAPVVQMPSSNNVQAPRPATPANNQGWQIVEEDHLKP